MPKPATLPGETRYQATARLQRERQAAREERQRLAARQARAYAHGRRSKFSAREIALQRVADSMKTIAERAVLVTTAHRGVFFGYATETAGPTIKLRAARNCLYWPVENKGFLGLANMGPVNGARVGPPADIELRDITCIAECTPAAVDRWETAPWK